MYQLAQVFKSPEGREIRTVVRDGEPWFVAQDVCSALDVGNPSQACVRLDPDEKGIISTDTLGGQQDMVVVSESGLYCLVLGSRKPEAKTFRKWVTAEVLPTLRKTGHYILPKTLPEALRALADTTERLEQSENAAKALRETVARLTGDGSTLSLRDTASHLDMPERELLSFLRDKKILYRASGHYHAYSRFGRYFRVCLADCQTVGRPICRTTGAGLEFLAKKLKKLK